MVSLCGLEGLVYRDLWDLLEYKGKGYRGLRSHMASQQRRIKWNEDGNEMGLSWVPSVPPPLYCPLDSLNSP